MEQDVDIVIEMQGQRYALDDLPQGMLYELLLRLEQRHHTGCIDIRRVQHRESERKQQIAAYVNRVRSLGYSSEEVISIFAAAEPSQPEASIADAPSSPTPTNTVCNTSAGRLYIITPTGQRIQCATSRRTLLEGIRLAGFDRVYAMQIPYMKGLLVDIKPNLNYPKFTFHEGDYYITIGNSDVPRMQRLAQQISTHLHLGWTVGMSQ